MEREISRRDGGAASDRSAPPSRRVLIRRACQPAWLAGRAKGQDRRVWLGLPILIGEAKPGVATR